jgi:NAD(P)-dependent dehydrogenase (short-subunit alcohol dehydrogenase family)
MSKQEPSEQLRPPQQQDQQPGRQSEMQPQPDTNTRPYHAANKLEGKVALITGADSGIGRAVAIAFAKEGADVGVLYLNEHDDAIETRLQIEQAGRRCLLLPGDIGDEKFCQEAVDKVANTFGHLDIVVNNAAEQHPQESIEQITSEQLERTFRTNIFSMFYIVKAAMKYLKQEGAIINTTSVTAYRGNPTLLDYSATKGAIVAFTRALSQALVEKGIRVNAVAPGPIWTPLIPATFPPEKVATFGSNTPMKRAGQPEELAPSYVFLACNDSSYMTGQVLHSNGGQIVNS